jgi:hypothetical protein
MSDTSKITKVCPGTASASWGFFFLHVEGDLEHAGQVQRHGLALRP